METFNKLLVLAVTAVLTFYFFFTLLLCFRKPADDYKWLFVWHSCGQSKSLQSYPVLQTVTYFQEGSCFLLHCYYQNWVLTCCKTQNVPFYSIWKSWRFNHCDDVVVQHIQAACCLECHPFINKWLYLVHAVNDGCFATIFRDETICILFTYFNTGLMSCTAVIL